MIFIIISDISASIVRVLESSIINKFNLRSFYILACSKHTVTTKDICTYSYFPMNNLLY